jgi:5-methylcytosine-specific restriction endonuclease McrA
MNLDQKELEIEKAWQEHAALGYVIRHKRRIALRARVGSEQAWRCCYCGVRTTDDKHSPLEATLEHIVPRSAGGPDVYENVVLACRGCNTVRGDAEWSVHKRLRE